MKMMLVAVVLLGATAANASARDGVLMFQGLSERGDRDNATTAAFIATQAVLAADTFLTLDIKNHSYMREWNPLLGAHPSDARIIGSIGAVMLAETAVYLWAPPKWSRALSGATLMVEIPAVFICWRAGLKFTF